MAWKIEFDAGVEKDLKKLGHTAQKKILQYIKDNLLTAKDPRSLGKPLLGDKKGIWRYRVGSYRLLVKIEEDHMVLLVVHVGHRKNVYN